MQSQLFINLLESYITVGIGNPLPYFLVTLMFPTVAFVDTIITVFFPFFTFPFSSFHMTHRTSSSSRRNILLHDALVSKSLAQRGTFFSCVSRWQCSRYSCQSGSQLVCELYAIYQQWHGVIHQLVWVGTQIFSLTYHYPDLDWDCVMFLSQSTKAGYTHIHSNCHTKHLFLYNIHLVSVHWIACISIWLCIQLPSHQWQDPLRGKTLLETFLQAF